MGHRLALVAMLGLLGCGGSVKGTVDGRSVSGAQDALFDRYELFGFDVALLWVTDAPDSCALFDEVFEVGGDCEERCTELNDIAQTYLSGDEQWTLATTLRIDGDAEGTYTYDNDLSVDTFNGEFFWWDVSLWQDPERCVDACQEWDELTSSDTESIAGGELIVSAADDETFEGSFDLSFPGEDELSGTFTASRCDMADWLF